MIQGLQVDVKSEELTKILKERLEYHEEKSKAYTDQAESLRKTMKNIEEDLEIGKVSNTSGDPAQNMDNKSREHKDKAAYYKFMLDHVIQNDTYRLAQEDLTRLGIAVHRFW